jgi:hypothetical protein
MLRAGVAAAFLPGAARAWTRLGSGLLVQDNELVIGSTVSILAGNGKVLWSRTLTKEESVNAWGKFLDAPRIIANAISERPENVSLCFQAESVKVEGLVNARADRLIHDEWLVKI